jgi:hypothetical protein
VQDGGLGFRVEDVVQDRSVERSTTYLDSTTGYAKGFWC